MLTVDRPACPLVTEGFGRGGAESSLLRLHCISLGYLIRTFACYARCGKQVLLFGWAFTQLGSYDIAFAVGVATLLAAGIVSLSIREKKHSVRYVQVAPEGAAVGESSSSAKVFPIVIMLLVWRRRGVSE